MPLLKDTLNATLWSVLAEIIAKIISPAVFLILTHILSPSDFGVVSVATTILGLIYVVSDMGTSKVLIQAEDDEGNIQKLYDAAFYLNIFVGIILFLVVFLFSKELASFYSQTQSDSVIKVMSVQILLYSLCSVQNAIRKRNLDFRFLFYIRLITICSPLLIALPIAFSGGGYWAIVLSTIAGSLLNTVVLWVKSKWKPILYINWHMIYRVIGKSIWNTIEQICVWIPVCFDTFLISKFLSVNDLGLYTTSKTLFNTAIGLLFTPILPVLFSAFSRYQNSGKLLREALLFSQKVVFLLGASLGLFVYIFNSYISDCFFSNTWSEISSILGIMFLIMGLESFYSAFIEGVRSKGYFKEIAVNTSVSILVAIPFLLLSVKYGLFYYVVVRSLALYIHYPGIFYLIYKKIGISFKQSVYNVRFILISIIIMLLLNYCLEGLGVESRFGLFLLKLFSTVSVLLIFLFVERKFLKQILSLVMKR